MRGMINLTFCRRFLGRLGSQVAGIAELNITYTNPVKTIQKPDVHQRSKSFVRALRARDDSAFAVHSCDELVWLPERHGSLAGQVFVCLDRNARTTGFRGELELSIVVRSQTAACRFAA